MHEAHITAERPSPWLWRVLKGPRSGLNSPGCPVQPVPVALDRGSEPPFPW